MQKLNEESLPPLQTTVAPYENLQNLLRSNSFDFLLAIGRLRRLHSKVQFCCISFACKG